MPLSSSPPITGKSRIVFILGLLLAIGFAVTSVASYQVSKSAILEAIVGRELPLTSDNIYSEIQKDLIRPIFVSSMMASDTFVRDWVLTGEGDVSRMTKYLKEVMSRYNAFTSFFVSDRTLTYYQAKGVLKRIDANEPRDAWYYRVRKMAAPYEINVDPDLANADALTIFINYRVLDYDGKFIGTTGVGLTVNAVRKLINDYQERYKRNIYFVDRNGNIMLFGGRADPGEKHLRDIDGLREIAAKVLAADSGSYQYRGHGHSHLLNARLVPELNWYLFVEKVEDEDLAPIRRTLTINLGISLAITVVILLLASFTVNRYQRRIEAMATTDMLTGLINRQGLEILFQQAISEYRRDPRPMAVLLLDVDHFKAVNDTHGHPVGDQVLRAVAATLQAHLRQSDIACRWGGEEFLILAKDCDAAAAAGIAEKLRAAVEAQSTHVADREIRVTLSAGVAAFAPLDVPEHVLARADTALYRAKAAGRNRVVLADAEPGR